jgi:hypothetical protein
VDVSAYCRCEGNLYSRGVDWDIWVSDPERAWCRSCGCDLRPEVARREYAVALSEYDRVARKFPDLHAAARVLPSNGWVPRWEDCPVCGERFMSARPGWTCCLACAIAGDPEVEAAFIAKAKEMFPGSVESGPG